MSKLDQDTRILYTLIAKHGSDWVKKRLCPKEAAQFSLDKHFNVARAPGQVLSSFEQNERMDKEAKLPESWQAHPAQKAMLLAENPFNLICKGCEGDPQAPTKIHPGCPQHGALDQEDDGEPQ